MRIDLSTVRPHIVRRPLPGASQTRRVDPAAGSALPVPETSEEVIGAGHVDPAQWHMALEHARHVAARFFRDGASPSDAARTFGASLAVERGGDWSAAVESIARALCLSARPVRPARAA